MRAVNDAGIATAWSALGSTRTRTDPTLDFSSPTIQDYQAGDAAWRGANTGLYNVDFADTGLAYLDRFEIRATTAADGSGTPSPDWSAVASGLYAESYTADWALTPGQWDLLRGGTNYISIRAWDGNNNSSTTLNAFHILVDTAVPVITDRQADLAGWRMDDPGAVFDVDFEDADSGLAAVEYSASFTQGSGNASALAWRPIAALTPGTSYYDALWGVDFAALANDATNYISVRARDAAGSTETLTGIDVFKILKYVSGPEVGITQPASAYLASLAVVNGTASDARSHAIQGTELSIKDISAARYWDGAAFTAVSPDWVPATGDYAWAYAPGITWAEGAAYQLVARSSDTSGNYSLVYATRTVTFDLTAPAAASTAPADGATVNSLAVVSGTALDAVSGVGVISLKLQRLSDGKWWDFAAATWTLTGSSAAASGGAAWSYVPGETLQASLETAASYYLALYAADNTLPANAAPFGVYGSTFAFLDNTAPAAVADLAASSGSAPGRLRAGWSMPGDDGAAGLILNGEGRVQYSTDPAQAFSTASAQVQFTFDSSAAGAAVSYEIVGLVPGQTYYLRAWARDDAGNWTAVSNAASAESAPYPDRISGHVVKVSSEGITGVLVEAFDEQGALKASAYTLDDGSGTYLLTGLAAGAYRVQASWSADDIISSIGTDGILLGAADTDFILEITYELANLGGELPGYRESSARSGRSGFGVSAVRGGRVELYQRGRLVATTTVDDAGRFRINRLLPGSYTLKVPNSSGGYTEMSVKLKPGQTLIVSPQGTLLKESSVYAYPNPAGKRVTFHIESDYPSILKQVAVFDLTGRVIKVFKDADFSGGSGVWEKAWDIPASVASGVYLYSVRVKVEATGETKKAVKKFAIVK